MGPDVSQTILRIRKRIITLRDNTALMKVTGSNNWDHVLKELKKLNRYQVAVGFFGERNSKLLTIVRANEYGAHIQPVNGQYLTIPTSKVPTGTDGLPARAKDIQGLFRPKGKNILCVSKGGELVVYYYLVKQVAIPARPFIRTAFIENQKKYKRYIIAGLNHITFDNDTASALLNRLGTVCVADIRKSSIKWAKPANAPATIERKKSSNPLVDTGNLQRSVTYKIIPI